MRHHLVIYGIIFKAITLNERFSLKKKINNIVAEFYQNSVQTTYQICNMRVNFGLLVRRRIRVISNLKKFNFS